MKETRRRRFARAAAVPLGLLASGALVFAGSQSAFTAQSDTSANNWATGTMTLKNDGAKTATPQTFESSSAAAAFSVSNMKPGDTGVKCIVVENASSLTGAVKFYARAVTANALSNALQIKVEMTTSGTGNFKNCTGYTGGSTLYGDAALSGVQTTYANGYGSWSPTGGGTNDYATYRITWTLPASVSDAVQGLSAAADFVWEIQNT